MEEKPTKIALDAEELARFCADVADKRKAEDVVKLKLTDLSVIADYFILCTGNTEPHIKAISDHIGREVKSQFRVRPKVEGKASSSWIVMDYGNVIIHIMTPEMRELYQLEDLWGDAPKLESIQQLENMELQDS